VVFDSNRIISGLRSLVVLTFLVYAPYYLIWRLGTFNPQAPLFSWLIWAAEVFGYLTAVLHVFMVSRLTSPEAGPAPAGYRVDVFIPTYNESAKLLRHTVLAALRMDYPHRTWLLDDGNRPEIEALASELGCRYLARQKNTDAKAGNLNNALRYSDADFIAVFDADHVPSRDFLTRTLGFFRDPRVAFVQTPQDFYNLDSFQHRRHLRMSYVWTEQALFYRVIQRGKDYWNAAYFCGSCAVLRRSALDAIGGFATGTVTEDLHTSIRLHKKKFRAVYYPHTLAFGLAPDSVHAFLVQRLRWGQGAMQVWRKEGILFARGLTFAQRLNYLASVLVYFDGWQKAIFYLSPVVVLTTGVMPIRVFGWDFLVHFIPYYVLSFWAYEEAGRGYGATLLTEQYNMARFATFARATIEGFTRRVRFRVTPKHADGADVRRYLWPQIGVLALSLVAITSGSLLWAFRHHLADGAFAANVIWAGINLGLAGAVVRFALRKKHRRVEYRFPIPLPAIVTLADHSRMLGLVEDISPDGCRLITETPIEEGRRISGEIFLPGERIRIRARVQRHAEPVDSLRYASATAWPSRPSRRKLQYGLVFEWDSPNDEIQLENFLYGSDLQWRILDLREAVTTPVAWLVSHLNRDRTALPPLSPREWLPVIYHRSSAAAGSGGFAVLSRGDWNRAPARLIVFEALPEHAQLEIHVFGQVPENKLYGEITAIRQLVATAGTVYTAAITFRSASRRGHRSSRWGRWSRLALGLVSMLLLAAPLLALADWLGLGGLTVAQKRSRYAYLGAVAPLPATPVLGLPGDGWVQRYWLDWVEYGFASGNDEIRARAPGFSAALGYQHADRFGYSAVYVGAGYRNTAIHPYRQDTKVRGAQSSALLSMETDRHLGAHWRMAGSGQYATGPDSYWLRGRALAVLPGTRLWLGIERVSQGDPDYSAMSTGLCVDGFNLGKNLTVSFKFGTTKQKDIENRHYIGLELVQVFRTQ
jgi:cellulose synthase (UDP-forming)